MKIHQILTEIDAGDINWAHSIASREQSKSAATSGFWLIDKQTGKKLHGPFKDYEAARTFKRNRPDRIPADAVIKPL